MEVEEIIPEEPVEIKIKPEKRSTKRNIRIDLDTRLKNLREVEMDNNVPTTVPDENSINAEKLARLLKNLNKAK